MERFERARVEGDLPADADVKQLAGFIRTVVYGMTVKAASGATREELEGVIVLTLSAWPRRTRSRLLDPPRACARPGAATRSR